MAKRLTIYECEGCTQPFSPKRSDTKNCPPCSILSRMQYVRVKKSYSRECPKCTAVYAPLHIQDHAMCAGCTPTKDTGTTYCLFCKQERLAVDPRVPLCLFCAKDKAKRKEIVAKLHVAQSTRKEKYALPADREVRVLELWRGDTLAQSPRPPAKRAAPREPWVKIQMAQYTEAELHDLIADPGKSEHSKRLARACLEDPNHALWNHDTPPSTA